MQRFVSYFPEALRSEDHAEGRGAELNPPNKQDFLFLPCDVEINWRDKSTQGGM